MTTLLRVLIVEDSEDDSHAMLRELQRGGYEVTHERVETRPAMQAALSQRVWDLILCDYTLPKFSARDALVTLQQSGLDLPFIIISGTIREESAVEMLKAGAHDFIVKGRMARLLPAIERERRDALTRRLQREAEAERRDLIARLEAINSEIERFTYLAFHDLRAPLITIKGFTGALKQDLDAGRNDETRRDVERIERAADRMDEILSDLLEFARIGRVRRPSEDVDLEQLVREALGRLNGLIRAKNIEVKLSPDLPSVYGDRVRLREVFENLIENAARYTSGQVQPLIEIGTRRQGDQQVIFVRDNGPGIDPRYHNRIFELFEKLDPATEGPGIGLALTRRIVEVHGGRIWVESEGEGTGSTFCLTLPGSRQVVAGRSA
ncbi:MAG TPA: ATP-binding protein [Anaerolineales bacterium]|nr:ATP-binding protein [Anaerolineales bacterium]